MRFGRAGRAWSCPSTISPKGCPPPTHRTRPWGANMEKVLNALEPREADLVRAFGVNGESTAETAARLNMSEGAVRVALHRALKSVARLRERMID